MMFDCIDLLSEQPKGCIRVQGQRLYIWRHAQTIIASDINTEKKLLFVENKYFFKNRLKIDDLDEIHNLCGKV